MTRTDWTLAGILAVLLATGLKVWALASGVEVLIHSRIDTTQHANARWIELDGVSTSLSTYRDPREDEEYFIDRHARAVSEMNKVQKREADAWRVQRR